MNRDIKVSLYDLVFNISHITDMVNTNLNFHHEQVAYISYRIAKEFDLEESKIKDLVLAASIHDIGSFSTEERIRTLNFEIENSEKHAEAGADLVDSFDYLEHLSPIIKYHHLDWNYGELPEELKEKVPIASYILHLADRISILISKADDVLNQKNQIIKVIKKYAGIKLHPKLVKIFIDLAKKDDFWLASVRSNIIQKELKKVFSKAEISLGLRELLSLSKFYSKIIDFRSQFTATHSKGVALTARYLAQILGWEENQITKIEIAGYLHDLGKLAVPSYILEKKDKLTNREINIIKSHTFYTYHILDSLEGLEDIKEWAAFHHEKLNGTGYPFRYKDERLSTGSRIMAVADIFTALTEDRPYRTGLAKEATLELLDKMVGAHEIDGSIVALVKKNYEQINQVRESAQGLAKNEYKIIV